MFSAATKTGSQPSQAANYIEDVFSTYLYTGTGTSTSQSINNGLDLSGEGGMVWLKGRNSSSANNAHVVVDTVRGRSSSLQTYVTDAATGSSAGYDLVSFNNNGFTVGPTENFSLNSTSINYASWAFRKQEKFFDVVTYTGTGSVQNISHSLGSAPGMMIIKCTSSTYNWAVYHRSTGATKYLNLNLTAAAGTASTPWNNTAPTSTEFTVGTYSAVNASGETYVAYLFAHDAGGFGTTNTDNVISCGSYTGTGSAGLSVSLGYEPQYLLIKNASSTSSWVVYDVMRGMPVGSDDQYLFPNTSDAEGSFNGVAPTATGFTLESASAISNSSGATHIYMAIRRPMKPPTSGTEVFSVTTGNYSTPYTVTTGFPVDLCYSTRTGGSARHFNDRLRGPTVETSYNYLATNSTAAEATGTSAGIGFQSNTSIIDNDWVTGANAVWWSFRRASGFFDEVCYTGNGSTNLQNHNLTVAPELVITKKRSSTGAWVVSAQFTSTSQIYLNLNSTGGAGSGDYIDLGYFYSQPTATQLPIYDNANVNASGATYVAYLFATVAGVSKVGSYTGTGSTQTIDCGFAGGARWAMIKRTDSTGDWWIWDTARGMVSGTDPRLKANATTASTNENWVYTATTGFQIVATDASVNASGGSYIFLAIA